MSISRFEIVQAARDLIGTPWQVQGRSRAGTDCGGVIVIAYRAVGIDLEPEIPRYSANPAGYEQHIKHVLRFFEPVNKPEPGDALLLTYPGLENRHCGLFTGNGFITINGPNRTVQERNLKPNFKAYRFRG